MKHFQLIKFKLSKFLVTALVLGTISASINTVQAATIKDLSSCSASAREAVSYLAANNIISGGNKGYFNPKETVTRGHMIKMLVGALGYDTTDLPSVPTFKDVPPKHWAFKYVEAAYREGIITKGAGGYFGINEGCTRQQMAAIFVRSLGLKDEQIDKQQELNNIVKLKDKNKISSWAVDHVEFVMKAGLMGGTGGMNFSPTLSASREQAAVVIYRYLNNKESITEKAKALAAPVQYPELFEAFRNGILGYKGDLTSIVMLEMQNKTYNEVVNLNFNINGSVNNMNARLKSKMDFNGTGLPTSSMEYDVISIGNRLYMKLSGENKWQSVPTVGLSSQDTAVMSTGAAKIKFEQLMRSYRSLTIVYAGDVYMNDVTAKKYEITLNRNAFNSLFPVLTAEGYFGQPSDMAEIMENPFEGKVEIYLDQQNRLMRDRYDFKANMNFEDTGDNIDINSSIDTSYTNIGTEIEISAPPSNQISQEE